MTSTTDRSLSPQEAGQVFVTPAAYADEQWFHDACAVLRREDPIHLVESRRLRAVLGAHQARRRAGGGAPPRASCATRPGRSLAEPRGRRPPGRAGRAAADADPHGRPGPPRLSARIDRRLVPAQEHGSPRGPPRRAGRSSPSTAMADLRRRCDFARDIAMPYPLQVILAILGLPESDYPRMLKLTQELFGVDRSRAGARRPVDLEDLDGGRSTTSSSTSPTLTEERRADPTDDLASVIANATIDGEPLGPWRRSRYYVIIATAGHDTTASAMAGGLHALIEHPDQLARLQRRPVADPDRGRRDHPLGHAGEALHAQLHDAVRAARRTASSRATSVLLSYPSANRDEEVFDDPFRFDVGRDAEQAPGLRLRRALLPRAPCWPGWRSGRCSPSCSRACGRSSSTATRSYMQTLFVGGVKRMPIRYRISCGARVERRISAA